MSDLDDLEDTFSVGEFMLRPKFIDRTKKRRRGRPGNVSGPEAREASRQRMNEFHRSRPHSGEGNPIAKLTWDQVAEIQERRGSAKELAAKFKVSTSTVYGIWSGKAWKGQP